MSTRRLFAACLAWGLGASLLAVAGLSAWMLSLEVEPPLWILLYSVPSAILIALLLTWTVGRVLVTGLSSSGLSATDAWGRPRFATWASIESARRVNLGGLRYAVLTTNDGKPRLWVPLFLTDQAGFEARVLGSAPESNEFHVLLAASA
jgi:hypothetical protein